MNVIFLDYDGVVNTPQWSLENGKWECSFSYPLNNKVNNIQAVQWVSEFCEKYGYSIVVTSTWRFEDNYKECLLNGGLREGITIIDKTPQLLYGNRGDEISLWLSKNPEVTQYLIFDDDCDVGIHKDHLIKCDANIGFGLNEYELAERLHNKFAVM